MEELITTTGNESDGVELEIKKLFDEVFKNINRYDSVKFAVRLLKQRILLRNYPKDQEHRKRFFAALANLAKKIPELNPLIRRKSLPHLNLNDKNILLLCILIEYGWLNDFLGTGWQEAFFSESKQILNAEAVSNLVDWVDSYVKLMNFRNSLIDPRKNSSLGEQVKPEHFRAIKGNRHRCAELFSHKPEIIATLFPYIFSIFILQFGFEQKDEKNKQVMLLHYLLHFNFFSLLLREINRRYEKTFNKNFYELVMNLADGEISSLKFHFELIKGCRIHESPCLPWLQIQAYSSPEGLVRNDDRALKLALFFYDFYNLYNEDEANALSYLKGFYSQYSQVVTVWIKNFFNYYPAKIMEKANQTAIAIELQTASSYQNIAFADPNILSEEKPVYQNLSLDGQVVVNQLALEGLNHLHKLLMLAYNCDPKQADNLRANFQNQEKLFPEKVLTEFWQVARDIPIHVKGMPSDEEPKEKKYGNLEHRSSWSDRFLKSLGFWKAQTEDSGKKGEGKDIGQRNRKK